MDEINILSFGGGVDSTALLAMHLCRDEAAEILGIERAELDRHLPRFAWVVFSDPGSEYPATYDNIAYAQSICEKVGQNFQIVTYQQQFYRHNETNEKIKPWMYRDLPLEERMAYRETHERMTIYEWLTEEKQDGSRGSLPMLPGTAHQCSDRFKGGVQRKWADAKFPAGLLKVWSLGIEANESRRHKRFTMNKGEERFENHEFLYPLVDLDMTREDCQRMLEALGWDYKGDGSPVEKSSCMWCPWLDEWEVERLVNTGGAGLEEAIEIERLFYENDKHERWHELGEPMTGGGKPRAVAGTHSKPFASGRCDHPMCCEKYGEGRGPGRATLIQLRYVKDADGKLVRSGTKEAKRLTIEEHIARVRDAEHGD